jgi:hypothetical protein
MAEEYRYPLTRICLRHGALTLPRTMLGLFPDEGPVTAVDTIRDEVYQLSVDGPRRVSGLEPLFRAHKLDVNDEIVIRPLEDGRFAITPAPRARRPDYTRIEAVEALLDELAEASLPVTEAEIRALYPDLPESVALRDLLESDHRFAYLEGRWQPADAAADEAAAREEAEAESRPATREAVRAGAEVAGSHTETLQAGLWEPQAVPVPVPAVPPPRAGDPGPLANPPAVHERRAPRSGGGFPGDASMAWEDEEAEADLAHVGRARTALANFGFRVEPLGNNQMLAHAELGRRTFTVLASALAPGRRLDWAALLARRRETGARYLAVFGEGRDLHRLSAPAELARATLWSFDGVERARALSRSVPISPFDLQAHFEQGGLFEQGLERFEKTVEARIEDRGAFSEVLTRLAALRAPSVFLLEELAGGEGTLPRDQVLKVLERLSDAPFHLVARVGSGEFCLRNGVPEALANLSEYALSLRGRLPSRTRQRLTGLSDPAQPSEGEADEGAVGEGAVGEGDVGMEAAVPTEAEAVAPVHPRQGGDTGADEAATAGGADEAPSGRGRGGDR